MNEQIIFYIDKNDGDAKVILGNNGKFLSRTSGAYLVIDQDFSQTIQIDSTTGIFGSIGINEYLVEVIPVETSLYNMDLQTILTKDAKDIAGEDKIYSGIYKEYRLTPTTILKQNNPLREL